MSPQRCASAAALALLAGALFALPVAPALGRWLRKNGTHQTTTEWALAAGCVALLYACAAALSAQTYNPFIYFRF